MKCPELDEFDRQTMQEEVARALASGLEAQVTTWIDGKLHYHRGVVQEISTKYLGYEDLYEKHRLDNHEIIAVMIVE